MAVAEMEYSVRTEGTAPAASGLDVDRYLAFLRAKVPTSADHGIQVSLDAFHPRLKPHQRAIAQWMVRGGRRACFAAFGLGKTLIQLEACRVARECQGGHALIVAPLGVRQEFVRDAGLVGIQTRFIRRIEEVDEEDVIYLTNYETVRDGKLDPRYFSVTSLDEASVLRGFGGTKTFREFMRLFADDDGGTGQTGRGIPSRFVATATPSPNEYIELLAYAAYLGVMDVGAAKTRFFRRDATKADHLTLRPHKEREFWLWVASWALFCERPSDRSNGYADTPIVKSKTEYSRSRWQIDAHGFTRSNGNRLLNPEDLATLPHEKIFKLFRQYGLQNVYDFEYHVRLGETLEQLGRLPVTFMLLQPPSWHPDVWTDIARMRTLNCQQERKGREMHLCPLQFDIVDRAIDQYSMPGEVIFDPFGGLATVPYCAIRKGRRGLAVELSGTYFTDGAAYCEAAERNLAMPTLFDLVEAVPAGLEDAS